MAERFEIVEKALLKMLDEKKYASLRDILVTMNPSDVAGLFDGLDEKQIPLMFRLLPKEQAAETFVEMEPEAKELLIRGFSDNELKEVLDELTERLHFDIGMFFGDQFVKHYPTELSWSYYLTPKRDIFVKAPVIIGFGKYQKKDGTIGIVRKNEIAG